jgi:hypothetical protein
MVKALIDLKCKHGKKITDNNRDFPHSTKLIILNELGHLDDELYEVLDWLRKLRNDAAHKPFFEMTRSGLASFKHTKSLKPEQFFTFLDWVIGTIMNRNLLDLAPIFLPNMDLSRERAKGAKELVQNNLVK